MTSTSSKAYYHATEDYFAGLRKSVMLHEPKHAHPHLFSAAL